MIILAHHVDWTLCPHHLLPVKLDVSIAYIPQGGVLGLSKLARLIQSNLSEPTLQEELTDDLADDLMSLKPTKDSLPPAGAAVLIYGEHLCMRMRGPKSTGETITSAMRGVFKDHIQTREEFLSLVRRK
jgi:GTP cyclohydrolase I